IGGTMDPNDQDELVSVSVRCRDLPAVYAYLGRLMAGEEPATDQGEQAWRAEDVAALKHHPRLHRAAEIMFDLAAKRPGEPVTYADVVKAAAGLSDASVRAALGGLTKLTKRYFGRSTWPVSVQYDA